MVFKVEIITCNPHDFLRNETLLSLVKPIKTEKETYFAFSKGCMLLQFAVKCFIVYLNLICRNKGQMTCTCIIYYDYLNVKNIFFLYLYVKLINETNTMLREICKRFHIQSSLPTVPSILNKLIMMLTIFTYAVRSQGKSIWAVSALDFEFLLMQRNCLGSKLRLRFLVGV